MNELIKETFYNRSTGFQSANKLYQKLKSHGITLQQIKTFLNKQETQQLHKHPFKIKHYFPIVAKYENEIFQIDLVDVSDISSTNDNYKWLLCAIDVFTRKAYAKAMKNETSLNVVNAMNKIIHIAKPEIINCDQGSEFISNEFKKTNE